MRIMTSASFLLAAGLSMAPGAAFAQMSYTPVYAPTGRPIEVRNNGSNPEVMRPDRDTPQSIEIYNHTLSFASCASKQNSGLVGKALASAPSTSSEDVLFGRLRTQLSGCNAESAVNILSLMRGALSEADYKALVTGDVDPAKIVATAKDSDAFIVAEQKWNKARLASDQAMIDATNCLVVVQPDVAHRLLLTRHGSREETAALDELFAKAPSCAGAKRPDNLSSAFLRAFAADSMYRLATSPWRAKFLPWTREVAQ